MPRISLVLPPLGSDEQQEFLQKVPPMALFRTLAHAPAVARRLAGLGDAVMMQTTLPPILRELAVLRVAGLIEAPYVLTLHAHLARGLGLSDAEIGAATGGETGTTSLSGIYPAIVAFAEASVRGEVTDDMCGSLSSQLGERTLVDLVVCIGYFTMLCVITKTIDLEPENLI